MSDIRQEFEEFLVDTYLNAYGISSSRGIYTDAYTQRMWTGYQAAHKAQQAEIERLKAEMKWMFEVGHWDIEHIQRIEQALEGNQ